MKRGQKAKTKQRRLKARSRPQAITASALRMEIATCDGRSILPSWAFIGRSEASIHIDPPGRHCYLAATAHNEVFIGTWDLERGGLTEVVSFRAPVYRGHPEFCVERDSLSIHCRGLWLRLSTRTWDVLGVRDLTVFDEDDGDDVLCGGITVPGFRFIWLTKEGEPDDEGVRVFDLEKQRVCLDLDDWGTEPLLIPGPRLRVLWTGTGLFFPGGELECDGVYESTGSYCLAPDESGLIELRESSLDVRVLSGVMTDFSGTSTSPELILPGTVATARHDVASSSEQGAAFALVYPERERLDLLALVPSDGGLEMPYRIPVATECALVQDVHAHRVALVVPDAGMARVVALSTERPQLPNPGGGLPDFRSLSILGCHHWVDERATRAIHEMRLQGDAEKRSLVRKGFLEAHAMDPVALVAFTDALSPSRDEDDYQRADAFLGTHWPDHPAVLLFRAHEVLYWHKDAQEAARLLSLGSIDALDPEHRDHARHVRAVSHFMLGDVAEALAALKGGLELDADPCGLRKWEAWARGVLGGAQSGASPQEWIAIGIRKADQLIADDKGEDAVGALDAAGVWGLKDAQALARYVAAFCIHDRLRGAERFRARFALAAFIDLLEEEIGEPLPWGQLGLSEEALDVLGERAEAWLSA